MTGGGGGGGEVVVARYPRFRRQPDIPRLASPSRGLVGLSGRSLSWMSKGTGHTLGRSRLVRRCAFRRAPVLKPYGRPVQDAAGGVQERWRIDEVEVLPTALVIMLAILRSIKASTLSRLRAIALARALRASFARASSRSCTLLWALMAAEVSRWSS